jgi:Tfp pilus assembly protein PilF
MSLVSVGRHWPGLVFAGAIAFLPLMLAAQRDVREASNIPEPQPQVAPTPQLDATPEQMGDAYLAHQRYQEAITAYKQAPPDAADVWNKMGIAYEMMFDVKDAENCFKRSLKLNPHNARVMNNLGTVYDSQKKYRAAEHMYRKALKADPQSAIIYKNLGTNLLVRHKYDKGWKAYSQALTLDPQVFSGHGASTVENAASVQERGAMNYYMAKSCVQANMPDRAIVFLRRAMNEGFTDPGKVAADRTFAKLRDYPAFQQLLSERREQ